MNEPINVGFTGTRKGMTGEQKDSVRALLARFVRVAPYTGPLALLHGDEAHADTEAAFIARALGYRIVAWPGPDPATRGGFRSDETNPPMSHLSRNRRIAKEARVLIAAPKQSIEVKRSGTWATVRYARKEGKPIYIVRPYGEVIYENPNERSKP